MIIFIHFYDNERNLNKDKGFHHVTTVLFSKNTLKIIPFHKVWSKANGLVKSEEIHYLLYGQRKS